MIRQTENEAMRHLRCAVYTRKSSEEGLDMEFNSLDAQREACEAYIASQYAEGWACLRDLYNDGGFSGGTLGRPALNKLIADIEAGCIDVVVVYKIDRLSRALVDFLKLVEIFDRNGVTFVSVTQSFNTTTSMGRLTLNILLSFAQFEHEVIGERIRDKVAASKKKGLWTGGHVPLGYEVVDRKLIVKKTEAMTVRIIFELFARSTSTTAVMRELNARGVRSKHGRPIDRRVLYKLLQNRIYRGEIVHKGTVYPGVHEAIVADELWNAVHATLVRIQHLRTKRMRSVAPALLRGLIFNETGATMTPHHTKKGNLRYCYYVSMAVVQKRPEAERLGLKRLPANIVEEAIIGEIRRLLRSSEIVARTVRALSKVNPDLDEAIVTTPPAGFDDLWKALTPAEKVQLVQLFVARVTVGEDGLALDLRHDRPQCVGGHSGTGGRSVISHRPEKIRVHVPLSIRKRAGRPRILPSKEQETTIPSG